MPAEVKALRAPAVIACGLIGSVQLPPHPYGPADDTHQPAQLLAGVGFDRGEIRVYARKYKLARHGIQHLKIDHIFHAHCLYAPRHRLTLALVYQHHVIVHNTGLHAVARDA